LEENIKEENVIQEKKINEKKISHRVKVILPIMAVSYLTYIPMRLVMMSMPIPN